MNAMHVTVSLRDICRLLRYSDIVCVCVSVSVCVCVCV